MGYNTNLVSAGEVPAGYVDLLDPKWKGKLTKSHPSYSGTSLTGTYAITKVLGWEYLEKLAKQGVQQLQSTTATPKSIASGDRDGRRQRMQHVHRDQREEPGQDHLCEGRHALQFAHCDLADAPHGTRLGCCRISSQREIQQLIVDEGPAFHASGRD
jgi:iron(III) transport system substrate-binding protein